MILQRLPGVDDFVTVRTVIREGRGEVSRLHVIPDMVADLVEELGADRAIKTLGSRVILPNVLHQVFRCQRAWGTQGKRLSSVGQISCYTRDFRPHHEFNVRDPIFLCALDLCTSRARMVEQSFAQMGQEYWKAVG